MEKENKEKKNGKDFYGYAPFWNPIGLLYYSSILDSNFFKL